MIVEEVVRQGINQVLGMLPDTQLKIVSKGMSRLGPVLTKLGKILEDGNVDSDEFQDALDDVNFDELKIVYGMVRKMIGI